MGEYIMLGTLKLCQRLWRYSTGIFLILSSRLCVQIKTHIRHTFGYMGTYSFPRYCIKDQERNKEKLKTINLHCKQKTESEFNINIKIDLIQFI